MSEDMTWESPPPNGRYDWEGITARLRARPNQWLKVFEQGPVSVVNALRQDSINAVHPMRRRGHAVTGFEVMTRNNQHGPPRTADLYLRWYVPEGE